MRKNFFLILNHEIGHIFGNGHIQGTIMDERIQTLFKFPQSIDLQKPLVQCGPFCEINSKNKLPYNFHVTKWLFDLFKVSNLSGIGFELKYYPHKKGNSNKKSTLLVTLGHSKKLEVPIDFNYKRLLYRKTKGEAFKVFIKSHDFRAKYKRVSLGQIPYYLPGKIKINGVNYNVLLTNMRQDDSAYINTFEENHLFLIKDDVPFQII